MGEKNVNRRILVLKGFYLVIGLWLCKGRQRMREGEWKEGIQGELSITKRMKRKLKIQASCASHTIVRLSLMWLLTFHVQIYYTVITALFFADVSNHYYIFVGISSI